MCVALAACAGEPPRRPNVMHPIDEYRAADILARTLQQAELDPERRRTIALAGGRTLTVDVAVAEHKYGIAYLTRDDVQQLGDAIPKSDPESDSLIIAPGVGEDTGWRALLLYDRAYLTDNLEGEAHSATTIAAEAKIERDARDFLLKAQNERWP